MKEKMKMNQNQVTSAKRGPMKRQMKQSTKNGDTEQVHVPTFCQNQNDKGETMKTNKTRTIQAILLALILGVFALSMGPAVVTAQEMVKDPGTGEMVTAPEYGGTLTLGIANEPKNIDSWLGHPSTMSFTPVLEKLGIHDWTADRSVFPFGYFSPAQFVRGALVESWEQPDPVTYVLQIRKDVRWHDKAPMNARALTAQDVEWNYHRYLGLGSGFSKGSPFLAQWGPLDDAGIVSVEATDPSTVVFKLAKPNPNGFTIIFIDNNSAMMNGPEVIRQHGEILDEEKIEGVQILTDWRHLVGTGPFMMTDWSKGTSLTYQKNADYWAHDEKYPRNRLPYVDRVKMLILPEEATRLAALRAGRLDYVGWVGWATIQSIDQVENLKKTNPDIQLWGKAVSSASSIAYNNSKPPFTDIRVRHALQMALDLETINKTYWKGYADVTPIEYLGTGVVGYQNPYQEWPEDLKQYYQYDPEGAKKLLDQAGYPVGTDGWRFETDLQVRDVYDVTFYEIAAESFRKIGVNVKMLIMDTTTWVNHINKRTYGMTTHSSGADRAPADILTHGLTTSTWSPASVWDPYYDFLVNAFLAGTTVEEQQRASKVASLYFTYQHYFLWGGKAPAFSAVHPWVKGYNGELDLGGLQPGAILARLWIDQDLK